MSEYISAGSEYNGKEAIEILLRPQEQKFLPLGIRVQPTEGAGTYKSTQIGKLSKVLQPYKDGFQGGTGGTFIQRKYTLYEMKAEASYSKQDYLNLVQIESLRLKNNTGNDITGSTIAQAEEAVMANAVLSDTHRLFWIGSRAKLHNSAGTYRGGTSFAIADEDEFYSGQDGIWEHIFDEEAPHATATQNEVRRVDIGGEVLATAPVAEVETITLTGTSGTANVTVEGKTYLATFATSLTVTATNFVSAHAADILTNHDIVVTSSGADLIFLSNTAGVAITTSIANVTTDLAGSVVATTPNVGWTLAADEALETFEKVYEFSTDDLKELHDDVDVSQTGTAGGSSLLRMYATSSMIDNYRKSLQGLGATEQAYSATVDGVKRLHWNNIPIIPMRIDQSLTNDYRGIYPHRAILTVADNMAQVLASANGTASLETWYERKDNKNLMRIQLEMGTGYDFPELMTVAF